MTLSIIGVFSFGGIIGGIILRDTFKTKKGCKEEQDACRSRICIKIDEIKTNIQKQISIIDDKREVARKENSDFMQAMYKHMGKVEQFMKDQVK